VTPLETQDTLEERLLQHDKFSDVIPLSSPCTLFEFQRSFVFSMTCLYLPVARFIFIESVQCHCNQGEERVAPHLTQFPSKLSREEAGAIEAG
jgi:hypothetical protein